jgi:hypothetical protein
LWMLLKSTIVQTFSRVAASNPADLTWIIKLGMPDDTRFTQ